MTAHQILNLAQSWVESTTEFDWDELPDSLRQKLLEASLAFNLWSSNYERVISVRVQDPPALERIER